MHVWVFPGYSGFLTLLKNMIVSLTGLSKSLAVCVSRLLVTHLSRHSEIRRLFWLIRLQKGKLNANVQLNLTTFSSLFLGIFGFSNKKAAENTWLILPPFSYVV